MSKKYSHKEKVAYHNKRANDSSASMRQQRYSKAFVVSSNETFRGCKGLSGTKQLVTELGSAMGRVSALKHIDKEK